MPFINVYIHFVWSTKNRYPYFRTIDLRAKVWKHILENARLNEIFIDFIKGYNDHCHCLISLGMDQPIQKTMQLIKGESAYCINKNKLTKEKFEWQDGYFAASVSASMIDRVRNYIRKHITELKHFNRNMMRLLLNIISFNIISLQINLKAIEITCMLNMPYG